jgi:YXWGXW repeat-containing protein
MRGLRVRNHPSREEIIMKNRPHGFVQRFGALALISVCTVGAAAAQAVIVERGAMPAPRVEVIPAAPGPGYNWVPGHWAWRGGGWAWIPGHHIRGVVPAMPAEIVEVVPVRPSPAHVWIKGHHIFEGGRWVWRPGVWARI